MKTQIVAIADRGRFYETRVSHPLKAMDREEFELSFHTSPPSKWPQKPGVIYTSNFVASSETEWENIETQINKGWIWIHDISVDPLKSEPLIEDRFQSLAKAHIICAPTDGILRVTSQVNPFGVVINDQIGILPPASLSERIGHPKRIYLNMPIESREWEEGARFVLDSLLEFGDQIEVFSPPSPMLLETLSEQVRIRFVDTSNYIDRIRLMEHIDIALFPQTSANVLRQKSDLELMEAMAHGVAIFLTDSWRKRLNVQKEDVFTVKTPSDWSEHLNACLDDEEVLLDVKRAGYQYVANNRLWSGHSFVFERIFAEGLQTQRSYERHRQIRLKMRKIVESEAQLMKV